MAEEVEKAWKEKERGEAEDEVVTTFDRVARKELPATIVYEDHRAVAFRDISPVAATHILIVPKKRDGLTRLANAEERHESILGHLVLVGTKVAKQEGLKDGYRLVINDGPHGCQSVYHLHVHLIGGKQLGWPPGV